MMSRLGLLLICGVGCLVAACGPNGVASVKSLESSQTLSLELVSTTGIRDGDRMETTVRFEGPQQTLVMALQIAVGVPTRLGQGSFELSSPEGVVRGEVREISLTFLGGQSDWPNLGGTFELLVGRQPRWRVHLPTTAVRPGPARH